VQLFYVLFEFFFTGVGILWSGFRCSHSATEEEIHAAFFD